MLHDYQISKIKFQNWSWYRWATVESQGFCQSASTRSRTISWFRLVLGEEYWSWEIVSDLVCLLALCTVRSTVISLLLRPRDVRTCTRLDRTGWVYNEDAFELKGQLSPCHPRMEYHAVRAGGIITYDMTLFGCLDQVASHWYNDGEWRRTPGSHRLTCV